MTIHKVAEAFPQGTTSFDAIQAKLAAAFPLVILTAAEITSLNFSQALSVAVPEIVQVRATGISYMRDPANTDPHNGVTVLVSADDKHYVAPLAAQAFTNVLEITNTPPGSPAAGDRYIVGTAPTGAWASNADDLTYYDGLQWVFVNAVIGQRVYVRDVEVDYQWTEAGTWDAAGSTLAGSVGAAELAFPWGMVVESEIATPPGTRATGATPTMPLGGTAANINDDTVATEGVTSALGNLSAASADGRVIAKLDLGSDIALKAIQVKGIKCSSGSSSANAMGLYYATAAAPTTWVQLSTGFTLTTADLDVARSGTFTARYVAVITEAKDWSTATHTLDDLNAYKAATSISDGVKYLVAANAIGAFSGQDTKIAEAWNGAYRFYTPYDGALLLNRATKSQVRFDSATGLWVSAGGVWVGLTGPIFTTSGSTSSGGSGSYTYSDSTPPTTSIAYRKDDISITHTAKRPGAVLRLTYTARYTACDVIALFRDAETNAIAWFGADPVLDTAHVTHEFLFTALDGASHTYHVRLLLSGGAVGTPTKRSIMIEEAA